ncbi:hypothetical protein BJ944DRAFT_277982 [Cunninghamella echinulata]|nr:hypothetical protein BJ944DRAFT_277982 [Cunninghamella echinulata]
MKHRHVQRASAVVNPTTNVVSRQRSTKSLKDRRRSSGALSSTSQHSQYQKPRKLIGDYYVGKTLGKGASGRVKLGVHKHTGEHVAIKIISKAHLAANPAIEKAVRREIAIMKLIRHPNVMTLIDVIDDPNASELYLILEYVQGGELFEYLVSKGRLSDAEARKHFQQIILGLDFCHHHLICHRDLKPENLLLDNNNNIKIADFGMASLQPTGSLLETSCGSPHYASPEIVAGMPYNGSASDIWSCGVILYALLTGHLPFDDENIRQLLKKVKAGKFAMPDDISRSAQDLIRRILVVDPSKRLTMEQIIAHPWFCGSEPVNLDALPVPPTANEIGRPVTDPSEIDDRILETIKFLWGETRDEVIIRALISKEHNMQKVVYVLLQQHSERYWQKDHDDDEMFDDDNSSRKYRTIGHRTERSRKCISMSESTRKPSATSTHSRPSVPWMADATSPATMNLNRRHSAAVIRNERPDFTTHQPPLPPLSTTKTMDDKPKMKKSETFYARFIKNVLNSRKKSTEPTTPTAESMEKNHSTIKSTFAGTLRRKKNPFNNKSEDQELIDDNNDNQGSVPSSPDTPLPPNVPTKSTLRQQQSASKNKIDPSISSSNISSSSASTHNTSPSHITPSISTSSSHVTTSKRNSKIGGKSLNSKRLSIRVPSAFRHEDGTKRFSFTLNGSKKQRKEIDMSMFENQYPSSTHVRGDSNNDHHSDGELLSSPPGLSDGSSLSCSSSSSSNNNNNRKNNQRQNSTGSNNDGFSSSTTSSSASSSSAYSPVTPTTTSQQASKFKNALRSMPGKGEFLHSPPPPNPTASSSSVVCSSNSSACTSRRTSQASFQSVVDRRGSHISTMNRPITPSLLSNNSTITTASGSYPPSPSLVMSPVSILDEPAKPSWINNLFFFKQPKVCSLVIHEAETSTVLYTIHRLINQIVEAKLYEKEDKQGNIRYKAEIKAKHFGKTRQVKCRLDIMEMPAHLQENPHLGPSSLVQFTQQQGDGIVLSSVVRQLQYLLEKEYPSMSSTITAGF